MNPAQVSIADTEALIKVYRAAAKEHGEAIEKTDPPTANKSADLIAAIYAELRRRGIEHQSKLLPLLSDIAASVRLWSASHALEFAATQGEPVLEKLSSAKKAIGLDAEMTLREWRAGRLQFP